MFKSENIDMKQLTNECDSLLRKLFPICRSITGNGVRKSLSILKEIVDFEIKEIPSGTKCYDWIVPNEWNVNEAFIKDSKGRKIVDFTENNLHLVSYSVPINKKISYHELNEHVDTLPNLPDAIPYRTSYYKKYWGFCIAFDKYDKFDKDDTYNVYIDSTLEPGSLTFGESVIQGKSDKEFLFTTYCCHPSMGNDNLSGLILWALLLRELKKRKRNYTYRFVVAPETIGHIAYLSQNEREMKNVEGGFILSCVAGPDKFSYHSTFMENHKIDEIAIEALKEAYPDFTHYHFDINSGDEKQYSSPYFRIPIGTICKNKFFEYDYYHTSKDNLDFINSKNLIQTLQVYLKIIDKLENTLETDFRKFKSKNVVNHLKSNHTYLSKNPYCEPMLSKRNLYPSKGGMIKQHAFTERNDHLEQAYSIDLNKKFQGQTLDAIRWILFYSDGKTSLEKISEITNFPVDFLVNISHQLEKVDLIELIS